MRVSSLECKSGRVHTVALMGRRRPVVKDVAQVGVAPPAEHLGSAHEEPGVEICAYIQVRYGFCETRPARPGLELCLRGEEVVAATDAEIQAVLLAVMVLPGKGRFRARLPGNGELLRRQLALPLLVGFDDLLNLFHLSGYGVIDLHGPDCFYGIPAHRSSSRLRATSYPESI